jgi:hypothetical protein
MTRNEIEEALVKYDEATTKGRLATILASTDPDIENLSRKLAAHVTVQAWYDGMLRLNQRRRALRAKTGEVAQ